MHPKDLSIAVFTYFLPEDKIAKYPLPKRDASKLLLHKKGIIKEIVFKHIADHLPANSLLVFNNSKVVEARLLFSFPPCLCQSRRVVHVRLFRQSPLSRFGEYTGAHN